MVDIDRRKKDWNWKQMLIHRQRCREYQHCYARVKCGKATPEMTARVKVLEEELDVLNLIMLRERASLDAERMQKAEEEAKAKKGWFFGWWSQPAAEDQFSAAIGKLRLKTPTLTFNLTRDRALSQ